MRGLGHPAAEVSRSATQMQRNLRSWSGCASKSVTFTTSTLPTVDSGQALPRFVLFRRLIASLSFSATFSCDIYVNLSWIDPGFKHSVQTGQLKKELGQDIWDTLLPGWQFNNFVSDELVNSVVMNDVAEYRPVFELMNSISTEITEEPIALQDLHKGRVGYTVRYKGTFDEVYELQAFPFDSQVCDVRATLFPGEAHNFVLENSTEEKDAWFGTWHSSRSGKYLTNNPEWWFVKKLTSDFSKFVSDGSGAAFEKVSSMLCALHITHHDVVFPTVHYAHSN